MIRRLSLRSRAAILLAAVLLVVTGVFSVLNLSGRAVEAASASATRIQAFDDANLGLRNGLADQETGVRGYALSADPAYLEPYQSGAASVKASISSLERMSSANVRTLLTTEERDASTWQAWAAQRVTSIARDGPGPRPDDLGGKRLFDQFRVDWKRLDSFDNAQLQTSGAVLSRQLQFQARVRFAGWLVVLVSLVSLAFLIFISILRPLVAQANVVGALDAQSWAPVPGHDRNDEIGRLAAALRDFRESLGERVRLAAAMNDLAAESDLDAVVSLAVDRICELVDAEDGTLTLVSGSTRNIIHSRSGAFAPGTLVEASSPGTVALARGSAVQTTAIDLPEGPVKDAVLANGYGPILVLPLSSGGEAVGTLNALRRVGRPAFDPTEVDRAEFIAPFVATAVKAARLIGDLREADSVKSRFLANMSHELRTPLNAIMGFAQVLSAEDFGPMNARQHRYIDHIENSGRRLLDLINDILDLAKVQAGLMQVTPIPTEVAPVVLESRSQVERQAAAKDIALEFRLTPGLWAHADPRPLQQVVLNLLSNAVKFTPDGGSIVVESQIAGDELHVVVRDTGIGIPPEEHERIFDEFAQVDNEESGSQRGTGLGLSLSRRLTELMGGALDVDSAVGEGSRFIIRLRAAEAPAVARPAGPRVLVVEDEAPNLEFLMLTLEQAGYQSVGAPDLSTALRLLERDHPAAVILDIALPDGKGWAVLESVSDRASRPLPPVLVVTAADAIPDRYQARVAAVLTKPVERELLLATLGRALAASEALADSVGDG